MLWVPAHAKVNLALEVTGRRPDGYHDIATVFAAIDWHDLVGVDVRPGAGRTSVTVSGADATLSAAMTAEGSILQLAAASVRRLGATHLDVGVHVVKRVPAAAGLGGGSADAAATLRAGAALLSRSDVRIDADRLFVEAASLGSDVPAVLAGGATLGRGRGEILTALASPHLHLAVAVCGEAQTAAAYAALHLSEIGGGVRADGVAAALARGALPDPADCGSALEAPAVRVNPALGAALRRLRIETGLRWHLTGSGGAAFHLAAGPAAAAAAAAAAAGAGLPARACRTLPSPLLTLPGGPRSAALQSPP